MTFPTGRASWSASTSASSPIALRKNQVLYNHILDNPQELTEKVKDWTEKELVDFGEWLLSDSSLKKEKVQKVFAIFPFNRLNDEGALHRKYQAAPLLTPSSPKRVIIERRRSSSMGTFGPLTNGALRTGFTNMVETPAKMGCETGNYLFEIAKWAIECKPKEEEAEKFEKDYQTFFEHLPAGKLSQTQQEEITKSRVDRDFSNVENPATLEKAAELAKQHFSDGMNCPKFAGKQRVLFVLTQSTCETDEVLQAIHEVMGQLRVIQREHYSKGYLGKREVQEVKGAKTEDLVDLFGTGELNLRLHRILGRPLTGILWEEEACKALTDDEITELFQQNLAQAIARRLIDEVIKEKRNLREVINWTQATFEQRKEAKDALYAEGYHRLVEGLNSEEVIQIFGKGEVSAKLHFHLKHSLEGVEWTEDAYPVLEGKVCVAFLKRNYRTWKEIPQKIKEETKNKSQETLALIFVAYQGNVTWEGFWKNNRKLTLEMKKTCASHYENWKSFPPDLKLAFRREELEKEFDFVIDKTWGDPEQLKEMNWSAATDEERKKGVRLFTSLKQGDEGISKFAAGLDSTSIRNLWGTGLIAARMHQQMHLLMKNILWDIEVRELLEREAYVQWVKEKFNQWKDVPPKLKEEIKTKSPEILAALFVAYQGDVEGEVFRKDNLQLTFEMKKKCGENKTWQQFPPALKEAFSEEERFKLLAEREWNDLDLVKALNWAQATPEQRKAGASRWPEDENLALFAAGLDSGRIIDVWGLGAVSVRIHQQRHLPMEGIDWTEEGCQALTAQEITGLFQQKPQEAMTKRLINEVIRRQDKSLKDTIDWTQATFEQRTAAKIALYLDATGAEEFQPLARGLTSPQVVTLFGKGKIALELHQFLKLPVNEVEWDKEGLDILSAQEYAEYLKARYPHADKWPASITAMLHDKDDATHAAIFMTYQGHVPESIRASSNSELTVERKKTCASHYENWKSFPSALREAFTKEERFKLIEEKNWEDLDLVKDLNWEHATLKQKQSAIQYYMKHDEQKAPECLREHCTSTERRKLFGLTFGEKVGLVFIGLLTLFGLYQLYKRWKKA
jgi:hypothetical protein